MSRKKPCNAPDVPIGAQGSLDLTKHDRERLREAIGHILMALDDCRAFLIPARNPDTCDSN